MAQKIIVKNKRTRELLELTLPEFKEKFKAELKTSLDNHVNPAVQHKEDFLA